MLADLVRRANTLDDLTRLFQAIGYTPVDAADDGEFQVVARWKRIQVLAATDPAPRERARREASRLARGGQCGIVAALAPGRELVLASPMPTPSGSSRVLALDLVAPDRAALELLEDLRPRSSHTPLAHALRIGEVLSTEAAGQRFFTAFRMMLERMAAALDRRHTAADRRMVALLALTRVLFLYFVQAKGWLDGRRHFLRALLDDALSRDKPFHSWALDPLFFGTLNRPAGRRSRRVAFGDIPYLNGGLFEPHAVERRVGRPHFPNGLWRDAFDLVFERFRFCVREAEEVDAVAPDMLGRVFERLMAPEERADTGTFYTPETVVRRIVDTALETALAGCGGLDRSTAHALVREHAVRPRHRDAGRDAVARLRVLDPAAGSGAFLLGALESLTDIRGALSGGRTNHARWQVRRDVLQHNLFGVDVNPLAVRLAELRLWLAVVADDPTEAIREVAPLPNLNGIVRQGDSLLDPLAAVARADRPTRELRAARHDVEACRRRLFAARGPERRAALTDLQAAERGLARPLLERALVRSEHEIRDLSAAQSGRDLFGARSGLEPDQRHRLRTADRRRQELRLALRSLEDGAVPFFSFDVQAPDVMAAGGFSAVVGNPPWVRAERLSVERRAQLRDRFAWWRATKGNGYTHLPDLAVAFLERALELTAPGGAVGMLVPSKLVSAGYGEQARTHLVHETRIAYLHRVSDREAAHFGATTYPLAIVLENRPPSPDAAVGLDLSGPPVVRQASLRGGGPWVLVADAAREALEAFRTSGAPLRDIATPALGVKTGVDAVFVGRVLAFDGDIAHVAFEEDAVAIERSLLRPAVRGRDVARFSIAPVLWILWTHDAAGRPRPALPPYAAAYLSRHRERLTARSDYRGEKPWSVYRVGPASARHRVVWRDLTRRPAAVVLEVTSRPDAVPLNTCYVAPAPDEDTALAIAAVLNSTWTAAMVHATADEAQNGYRRMNARVAGGLPIPAGRAELAGLSRDRHANPNRKTRDRDLDEAVGDALGLTPRTRDQLRRLAAHLG